MFCSLASQAACLMGPQYLMNERKVEREIDSIYAFMIRYCIYLPSVGISTSSLVILFPNLHTRKTNLILLLLDSFSPVPSACHKRTILTNPVLIHSFPLEWERDEKSSQMDRKRH